MDTKKYHNLCSRPECFSRTVLEKTLKKAGVIEQKLIKNALLLNAIEKPELHNKGAESDYIKIYIKIEDAETIVEELGTLERQSISFEGNTTPEASHYASLLDCWFIYVESL